MISETRASGVRSPSRYCRWTKADAGTALLILSLLTLGMVSVSAATKTVSGQLFHTTEHGSSVRLGGIEVFAFAQSTVSNRCAEYDQQVAALRLSARTVEDEYRRATNESYAAEIAELQASIVVLARESALNLFKGVDGARLRIAAEAELATAKKEMQSAEQDAKAKLDREVTLLRKHSELRKAIAAMSLSKSLAAEPNTVARATSDADGRFFLQLPIGEKVAVAARVHRPVERSWLLWFVADRDSDSRLILSDHNAFGSIDANQVYRPGERDASIPAEISGLNAFSTANSQMQAKLKTAINLVDVAVRTTTNTYADVLAILERVLRSSKEADPFMNDYLVEGWRLNAAFVIESAVTEAVDVAHKKGGFTDRLGIPIIAPPEFDRFVQAVTALRENHWRDMSRLRIDLVAASNRKIDEMKGVNVVSQLLLSQTNSPPKTLLVEPDKPRTLADVLRRGRQAQPTIGQNSDGRSRLKLTLNAQPAERSGSDALLAAYDDALRAKIEARWRELLDQQNFAIPPQGVVSLNFEIDATGRVGEPKSENAGSNELLRLLCHKALVDGHVLGCAWPDELRMKNGTSRRRYLANFECN